MKLAMFSEAGHAELLASDVAHAILADYRDMYGQQLARHFVTRGHEGIIASAGAFLKSDVPFRYFDPPHYGFIGDVYTDPAYRGRGIAKTLNHAAIDWLRTRGIAMIRPLASESGRSMYTKLGFRPSDEMVLHVNYNDALTNSQSPLPREDLGNCTGGRRPSR